MEHHVLMSEPGILSPECQSVTLGDAWLWLAGQLCLPTPSSVTGFLVRSKWHLPALCTLAVTVLLTKCPQYKERSLRQLAQEQRLRGWSISVTRAFRVSPRRSAESQGAWWPPRQMNSVPHGSSLLPHYVGLISTWSSFTPLLLPNLQKVIDRLVSVIIPSQERVEFLFSASNTCFATKHMLWLTAHPLLSCWPKLESLRLR